MKTNMIRRMLGAVAAVGLSVLASSNVSAQTAYAVDLQNTIFTFNTSAPGTILGAHPINGLGLSESVVGIDWWNGTVYALGTSSKIYTVDPNTGLATAVGAGLGQVLNGFTFGVDNGPGGFQIVSDLGQNLTGNRATGATTSVNPTLAYASGDPNFGSAARIDGLAYDPFTASWYGVDYVKNILVNVNIATGSLTTIGSLGIDISRYNGLEISPSTGTMYLGTPANSSDPQANLYTVNKATGLTTLVGLIGQSGDNILVRGLTVVPEPSTLSMLALGGLALGLIRRRK